MTTKVKSETGSESIEKNVIAALLEMPGLQVPEYNLHALADIIKRYRKLPWSSFPGLIKKILHRYENLAFSLELIEMDIKRKVHGIDTDMILLKFRCKNYKKIDSAKIIYETYKEFDDIEHFRDILLITTDFRKIKV